MNTTTRNAPPRTIVLLGRKNGSFAPFDLASLCSVLAIEPDVAKRLVWHEGTAADHARLADALAAADATMLRRGDLPEQSIGVLAIDAAKARDTLNYGRPSASRRRRARRVLRELHRLEGREPWIRSLAREWRASDASMRRMALTMAEIDRAVTAGRLVLDVAGQRYVRRDGTPWRSNVVDRG